MRRFALLALLLLAGPALAQSPTQSSGQPDRCAGALDAAAILNCLKPAAPAEPEVRTRALIVSPKAPAPAKPASVNLWINFAYNSADLTTDARISLEQLARALKDPTLAGRHFQIAGHTDAAGTAEFNQALSERRAVAVRDFLMREGGLTPEQLKAVGFGFTRLINPADPRAAENRRVEVTLIDQ